MGGCGAEEECGEEKEQLLCTVANVNRCLSSDDNLREKINSLSTKAVVV